MSRAISGKGLEPLDLGNIKELDLDNLKVGDRGLATFVRKSGSRPICEHSHGLNQGSTTLVLPINFSKEDKGLVGHPILVAVTSQSKTLGGSRHFFVEPIG